MPFRMGIVKRAAAQIFFYNALALRYNLMSANSLKLLSALIVAATLAVPAAAAAVRAGRERKENRVC